MYLWQQQAVPKQGLAGALNALELEHWEIFQILPGDMGELLVLARKTSTSYEIREAVEEAEKALEESWIGEARAIARSGKKIQAIKLVRSATGMGLKEAKDYVESNFY